MIGKQSQRLGGNGWDGGRGWDEVEGFMRAAAGENAATGAMQSSPDRGTPCKLYDGWTAGQMDERIKTEDGYTVQMDEG